ncbi:MAG: hypothetical protein IJM41_06690 [Bacteroidales bacterium]|nr:hypothetical protein [Bacteroidales bacterium]
MNKLYCALVAAVILSYGCSSEGLSGFKSSQGVSEQAVVENHMSFNGYTNHWENVYENRYRYGNFYRLNVKDVGKTIAQSRKDIAQALGIPGMRVQEGFFASVVAGNPSVIVNPSETEISEALKSSSSILAFVEKDSDVAGLLEKKDPMGSPVMSLDAFVLKHGKKVLNVVLGDAESLKSFKGILTDALEVVGKYDMKKGWFGAETLIQSVTCTPGDPVDVMGLGMNEGNSWFIFSGYCDFLMRDKLAGWVKEIGDPVVTDVGYAPIFGCNDWSSMQVQMMKTAEDWTNFRKAYGGYIFRDVPEGGLGTGPDCDAFFAAPGNARQINTWGKPFAIRTGSVLGGLTNSMVLFVKKGERFDKEKMWEAIMSCNSVAIADQGVIMGPDMFRKSAQLLALDRVYLEDYFGDRINMESFIEGHTLNVKVTNLQSSQVSGKVTLTLPEQIVASGKTELDLSLPAGASRKFKVELIPSAAAMGRMNAVMCTYDWGRSSKSVMASFNLPPAVSVHQLLYGPSSGCRFPVSVHNITANASVPVKVSVFTKDSPRKEIFSEEKVFEVRKGDYQTHEFNLVLPAGGYTVCTEAMGVTAETQLGIGTEPGEVKLEEKDLNGDGVNEYVLENDKVRVTLLRTGARVIEYYVKSKDDNVLFKLWPEKASDHDRPNREWGYYPYGGFEDFLGQASVETHKLYDAEVIKAGGEYAEVRMRADYYGTIIEKTFSLYGGSPLLGVRFALDIKHPEMNVLGPQPIIEIGKKHGLEDRFIIPEPDGITSYIMDPVSFYGKILYPVEGWNAAYDTKENVSFVGAFPVRRPYYLHMWMNLPHNRDAHYSYCELQPWLPLYTENISYFSYYMWAEGSIWNNGVDALRERNLITQR